jgi:hypothetical protein
MTATAARIIGLSLLIGATLVQPETMSIVTRPDIQVVIAAIVIFVVAFIDHIFGFLLGLSAVVLYSRVHMYKYGISVTGYPMSLGTGNSAYVTPAHLDDAQNNVIDTALFSQPYKGIDGNVLSAQGLENDMPGIGVVQTVGQDF